MKLLEVNIPFKFSKPATEAAKECSTFLYTLLGRVSVRYFSMASQLRQQSLKILLSQEFA